MSDQNLEEQEMEAEALSAIFEDAFDIISSTSPFSWSIKLMPVDTDGDEEEEKKLNHVMVKLMATLPPLYPEEELPKLDIQILKGLAEDQRKEILELAEEEAEANAGMPAIFACAEAVRTWLADNNVKGQDDGSMYAQMMRKAKDAERNKANAEQKFESQKKEEEMTEAELEELTVRKRREEGTPCTAESFLAWKTKFDAEVAEEEAAKRELEEKEAAKRKEKIVDTSGRRTGYEVFSGKAGIMNLEAIEAAVENIGDDDIDVDEELFDDDDDLDDLDFDDDLDSDDFDDDDDEEPDI
mmetsp:Transcript_25164/g.37015  ORF Transcript_25164/g.37015 Transcript_25164/m.37015 type:complete len:298 (-) Transcript_25164:135-1028(-)|eukprot:CAMPEP_0195510694 /NCGR_PEP_ID=MMETSP0794_2-20130614/3264_1 /TAXON_ID=515487 /ORGANISM="Stephanopyxis turris, Strain CCMP 815" /LENGTH=297 /DNA_ID=CAMNT_0040638167 /DNA_START=239 /DNA_END=1132 /DNA_ORIENTATION=-